MELTKKIMKPSGIRLYEKVKASLVLLRKTTVKFVEGSSQVLTLDSCVRMFFACFGNVIMREKKSTKKIELLMHLVGAFLSLSFVALLRNGLCLSCKMIRNK